MEEQKSSKAQIGRSLAILAVIVVIFPAISWYYLQKGLDFRNDQLAKLDDLGEIVSFQSKNNQGLELGNSIKGNVLVISTTEAACQSPNNVTLREYVEKFQNQDVFRHIIVGDEMCDGWKKSFFAPAESNVAFSKNIRGMFGEQPTGSHVLLVDREGRVRKVYDLTSTADLESLVTHTTTLLPPLKKRG